MNAKHNGSMRIEEDINVALKMLGEAQPPDALVSRVHESLEAAAVSRRYRSSRRGLLIPVAGVAAATLVLVAIFIPMPRTQRYETSAAQTRRVVANTPQAQVPMASPSVTVEAERASEGKRLVQYYTQTQSRRGRGTRRVNSLLSYPLTRQEKLLLQFVHNAKPADLQALNPEYQAKVEARQKAEFAAYLKSTDSPNSQELAN